MFDEKKRLPDLPPAEYSPDDFVLRREEEEDEEDEERHALPAFPDTPAHNKFSQAVIKEAVADDELTELLGLPELPEDEEEPHPETKAKIIEMKEWAPEHGVVEKEYPRPIEIPRREDFIPVKREIGSPGIFVKIDKFRSARKTFNEVKTKLSEIDDLIKRIRETKIREEQELNAWEKDVTQIKARVRDVSEDIFEKVE